MIMPLSTILAENNIPQFIFCGNNILIILVNNTIELPSIEISKKCMKFQVATDWFTDTDNQYTALMLEDRTPPPIKESTWIPLRQFFAQHQDSQLSTLAARAHGLLNWRHTYRYCPRCGTPLHDSSDITARLCIKCGHEQFPILEPAIIVIVHKDNKILLARHKHRNTDVYTCLAGYVEIGETIEQCVYREIKEETGIEVTNITYQLSQSWPFPDQLMLGFSADWKQGEITPQQEEIQEAEWFDKENLPPIPKPGSLAYRLITEF